MLTGVFGENIYLNFYLHLMLTKNGLDKHIYIYIINAHTADKALLENTLADRWYEIPSVSGI